MQGTLDKNASKRSNAFALLPDKVDGGCYDGEYDECPERGGHHDVGEGGGRQRQRVGRDRPTARRQVNVLVSGQPGLVHFT